MNKKIVIILIIILLCGAGTTGLYLHNSSKNVNPSRRDGQMVQGGSISDEDLEGVSGDDEMLSDNALSEKLESEAAKKREKEDEEAYSSLQSIEATEPVSQDVESVEVILIPEAVAISEGNQGEFYGNDEFTDITPVDISSFSEENIPSKYDSRNVSGKNYITAVEDQGYSYLCWTYAALGAVESDILKHNPDISRSEMDLSEKHLAYYNMHKCEGSVGGYIDEDYREFVNADDEEDAWIFDYDTNYIATGGVADFCISLLTAWKGPVSEKENDAFTSIYGEKKLFKDNSVIPSSAFTSEYHVQNVNEIPANYANNMMIKQMIMEHGSVTAGINSDEKFWKNRHSANYSCFDGEDIPTANHEILIVGWDDDYSADNFSIKPPANGAWMCRNSWGTSTGIDGYFYLSYYDETIGNNNAAAYSSARPGDDNYYDHNYQAAGFITNMTSTLEDSDNYITAFSESVNPYGMLYTACKDEKLEAIGLMSLETYSQYELKIFVNPVVEDGRVLFSDLKKADVEMKASAISGGYHTFELPEEITLSEGDTFFILVKPENAGKLVFENASDHISKPNYDEWNNLTGNIHNNYNASGCSFYIAEDGMSMKMQDDRDFFVKAYTKDNPNE
ncbi:C1 family peptidase [Butyrivibrio sp. YAB3001]|uniref:C1 family peptidase n=1 Tax=Butyrivibrio sp. YAB3001 TaxID=1520812 RepID=UPI0008F680C4|nr:C1 family peptidase [Butyrivibrio sp. YAB3001]SFD01309.1 Cysteine protease, C1A family [Butyrivibrio sp. YAB3001]